MIGSVQLQHAAVTVLQKVEKAAEDESGNTLTEFLVEQEIDPGAFATAIAQCCANKEVGVTGGPIEDKAYRAGVYEGMMIGIAAARMEAMPGGQCQMCGARIKIPTPEEQAAMHENVRRELTEAGQVDEDTDVQFEDVFLCPKCAQRINAANN